MDDENISLTNPRSSVQRGSRTLYLWWGLNVLLVIFVFLAFLFSTLTYSHSKHLAKEVNNSFITQQGGLIQQTYKVSTNFSVLKGQAVSFCATNQVCSGLGPEWGEPFYGTGSATPAVMGGLVQLTPTVAVYAAVSDSDHTMVRVTVLDTSASSAVRGTSTIATGDTISALEIITTSNNKIAAVFYSSHNVSYIVAASVSDDSKSLSLGAPIQVYTVDTINNGPFRYDFAHVGQYILVTYAHDHEGANYAFYSVDTSSSSKFTKVDVDVSKFSVQAIATLATAYLDGTHGGWFIQGNANSLKLGWIDYQNKRVDSLANAALNGYYFDTLTITKAFDSYVVVTGVQFEYVDTPLTLSLIVQWNQAAPYLTVYSPTNLLGTQNHQLLRDQLSVCYVPPFDEEPLGGLFYTYVDAQSLRAKLMRARTAVINGQPQLLPSPSVDISTIQYGKHGSWLAPLLSCPTVSNRAVVVVQDFYSIFNTFSWKGGFRYAGLAQADAGQGKDVNVVRQGISSGHTGLIPGFHYYMYNNGTLAPYTSIAEVFTPNGFPWRVGTALTDTLLYLEDDIFDRFY